MSVFTGVPLYVTADNSFYMSALTPPNLRGWTLIQPRGLEWEEPPGGRSFSRWNSFKILDIFFTVMDDPLSNNAFAKLCVNLLLVTFSAYFLWIEHDSGMLTTFILSVLLCTLIETAAHYLKEQRVRSGDISLTTWLIIAIAMSGKTPWWVFLGIAFAVLVLKYFARSHGRGFFNPAALGIFLAVLVFGQETDWKMAHAWYVLVPAGLYLAYLTGQLEVLAGYFAVGAALFAAEALRGHAGMWSTLGSLNYFFIFMMLTEPKNAPFRRWPKVLYGAGVAGLSFVLGKWGFRYEPALFALLVFNILSPALDKIPEPGFPGIRRAFALVGSLRGKVSGLKPFPVRERTPKRS